MSDFIKIARSAAREAHMLLDGELPRGAISRAYYAMFDAAQAALAAIDESLTEAKTHRAILNRFSKHVVKERGMSVELTQILYRASELRMTADYGSDAPDLETARHVVAGMDRFLDAVSAFLESGSK
jgi:uncharacterized protein (UPF0332 family)